MSLPRRALPASPARRGWCPSLARPMPTGDGLLARVHPPLGILTLSRARAVAEGARRFGNGHIDLTARANLQIRGVSEATRTALAALLERAGLGDVRADGGPQRLTLTSPLAGIDPAEAIDVPALARAVEAAGREIAALPPKTLVAVIGTPGGPAPEADLTITARGHGGVAVSAAGRDLAVCATEAAPDLLAALLGAFARTGRRRVRDLSEAGLGSLIATGEEMARVPSPARERGRVAPDPPAAGSGTTGSDTWFVPPAGLSALGPDRAVVTLEAPFGRCTADGLDRLAAVAADLGAGEIRLSSARGLVLVVPHHRRAADALAALDTDFITRPDDPRRRVAACTGAPACAAGTTPTLTDAARIAHALGRAGEAARGEIHVSGCAKGCARPGLADLTLVGADGLYGVVLAGGPGDAPGLRLPIEAALERLGRSATLGLAAAFAPEGAAGGSGGDLRPA